MDQFISWVSQNKTHLLAIAAVAYAGLGYLFFGMDAKTAGAIVAGSGLLSAHKSDLVQTDKVNAKRAAKQ